MEGYPPQKPKKPLLERGLEHGRVKIDFDPEEYGMVPIALEALVDGVPCPVDFFLPMLGPKDRKLRMDLAANRGDEFSPRWRDNLLAAEQKRLFFRATDAEVLSGYFSDHAARIMTDDRMPLRKKALAVQEMASLNLQCFFGKEGSPAAAAQSVQRTKDMVSRLAADPQVLTNLSQVLQSNYSVYTHSVNVCLLSMAFGLYLGLDQGQLHSLGVGALLHDVGKSKLPRQLLNKPGSLSSDEMALVKRHPREGYKMLLHVGSVPHEALMVVLHHHENADGSGYPSGLKAENTPRLARLVRVVDAFDAMTSRRAFSQAKKPFDAAGELIQQSLAIFGADLVPPFVRFLASPYITEG